MTPLHVFGALAIAVAAVSLGGCASVLASRRHPPVGEFVTVGAERIHLIDRGPRESPHPPIVLIHGASANLRDMDLALGDRLAAQRRVLIVDRPGRGYSTRGNDGWRLETQAQLIHEAVKMKGVERPVVVGQSLGGAVALSYGLAFQDEIAGLVLLAPVSHEWPGGVAWYNEAAGWPVLGPLLRWMVIPLYGPIAAKSGVPNSFHPDEPPEDYYERAAISLLFRPHDFRANAEDLRNLKAQIIEMQTRYDALSLPVEIVTGADDRTVSPKIHSHALAEAVSHAGFTLIPDTGHAIHHAEPDAVMAAIDRVSAAR